MMLRRVARLGLVLVGVLAVLLPATAAEASGGVFARAFSFGYSGVPAPLPAGTQTLHFKNTTTADFHELIGLNLGPVCATLTRAQMIELIDKAGAAVNPLEVFGKRCPGGSFAGAVFAEPGHEAAETFHFAPGRVVYFCAIPEEDGTPHYHLGMLQFRDAK